MNPMYVQVISYIKQICVKYDITIVTLRLDI